MIYVYCERKSNGARDLVEKLNAQRVRRFDGMDLWVRGRKIKPRPEDLVICWGKPLPKMDGINILNAGTPSDKVEDIRKLVAAGVPTVQTIGYPTRGFVKRKRYHVGGNDLLNPPTQPDFYVRKYTFVDEYRVHSFDGKAIKSGRKVPRAGFTVVETEDEWKARSARGEQVAHPWVKSYDAGWMVNYVGFHSDKFLRKVAHKAVEALGLTFGAVDIGDTGPDSDMNRHLVLEVNRAPGMEGTTIDAYVRSINRWMGQEDEPVVVEPVVEEAPKPRRGIDNHPLATRVDRMRQEEDAARDVEIDRLEAARIREERAGIRPIAANPLRNYRVNTGRVNVPTPRRMAWDIETVREPERVDPIGLGGAMYALDPPRDEIEPPVQLNIPVVPEDQPFRAFDDFARFFRELEVGG